MELDTDNSAAGVAAFGGDPVENENVDIVKAIRKKLVEHHPHRLLHHNLRAGDHRN